MISAYIRANVMGAVLDRIFGGFMAGALLPGRFEVGDRVGYIVIRNMRYPFDIEIGGLVITGSDRFSYTTIRSGKLVGIGGIANWSVGEDGLDFVEFLNQNYVYYSGHEKNCEFK
jgi:translation initiation factor 2 gamma subunit (eIF-2gamma)